MDTIWRPEILNPAVPKYRAVVEAIRSGIADRSLEPGSKLPPVRDLAWRLGITPGTVARAYSQLTDDGTLTAGVGRGTFVAEVASPDYAYVPIEVDSTTHNSEAETYEVNLISPHLPSVGQAALIRRLLTEVAEDPPSGFLHYPNRVNAHPAQVAALSFLTGTPLGSLSAHDIVLAHGGQNAILVILQALLRGRKPVILVEELAYPGFGRAAELLRAEIVPVAMDTNGVIPEALQDAARAHEAQVFCTSAEVHNPTCGFTPPERRAELARVAQRCDLQILEDDCYRIGPSQAPSYRMLAPERGWYVASISKSLTPALRLGIAVAPQGRTAALRRAAEHSYFGLATPLADLAASLLSHPQIPELTAEVRRINNLYLQSAVNILGSFDLSWRRDVPFVWLQLPPGWRASAFCQAAAGQGVRVRPAEDFAARDAQTPHAIRLAINAGVSQASFEAALTRLRDLLANPADQIGV